MFAFLAIWKVIVLLFMLNPIAKRWIYALFWCPQVPGSPNSVIIKKFLHIWEATIHVITGTITGTVGYTCNQVSQGSYFFDTGTSCMPVE